ncbi:KdsC family phosphatase [Bythopirellula polymerisocia]|uniref:3-deoxy-D-manno-octulosonate 8-phosphate phosphatase KdsC n=1 Tax=Bythopirellula polymerisocia TaxID=2528003 RepID=A0A5C6CYI5_9BACT|nr:HAD hydrolase family protein [Bythopirellula polymerisocia]TWU29682.1 3-deoxy-D-manno-octulosonate 8-phosphate phosphatase KdsC [Bythopirellula polymerisocia]
MYAAIRLILSDVDGVLTDGRLIYDSQGGEAKQFHIRDGQGIRLWQQNGGEFGIVTARRSPMVTRRAAELDITLLRQGAKNKLADVSEIATEFGCGLNEICYVGDDLLDLATIESVGLGVAVADAVEEVRQAAKYVTSQPGGQGAIRELIELILKNTNRWESTIRNFGARG